MPSLQTDSKSVLINSEAANKLTHEIILKQSAQVSGVKAEHGPAYVLVFLTKVINELGRCVQNDWSVDDKIFFAESLMNEFWYIRMDDFIMAFKKGIAGNYGKVYGKLDYATICEWINKWWDDRQNYLQGKVIKEAYDSNRSSNKLSEGEISIQRGMAEYKSKKKYPPSLIK